AGRGGAGAVTGGARGARRPGAVLTIVLGPQGLVLDGPQVPDRSDRVVEAGLELEDGGHGLALLRCCGFRTRRSKHGGETTTVDERLFDVKEKSNGCLPRTRDRVTVESMSNAQATPSPA